MVGDKVTFALQCFHWFWIVVVVVAVVVLVVVEADSLTINSSRSGFLRTKKFSRVQLLFVVNLCLRVRVSRELLQKFSRQLRRSSGRL
jgi:hypothetical protein